MRKHSSPSWLTQHLIETGKTIIRLLSEAVIVGTIIGSVWAVSEFESYLKGDNHQSEDILVIPRCPAAAQKPHARKIRHRAKN